jgi:dipeptidyl-peptidase-4
MLLQHFTLLSAGTIGLMALAGHAFAAAPKASPADPALLTLARLFTDEEFKEPKVEAIRWSKLNPGNYFTLDAPKVGKDGRDLVQNEAAGGHKTVLASAQSFLPAGTKKPPGIDSFEFSSDESRVLLFTSTRKVWRKNTRGDYWVMDVASKQMRKLGGKAGPSTLMFAKFSPDGTRVAYVQSNNLYVQNLADMKITALTQDGTAMLINGTSDWVNEEELFIRDGFRWSPDGTRIVFWQFDAGDVKTFSLVNQTDGSYQRITTFPYPKAGEKNSATRLGLVNASGGPVTWLQIPGDPREHYLPQAEWTPDGRAVLVQQLNRLQNTNRLLRADPLTGKTTLVLTETDKAWVENHHEFKWIGDAGDFLWLSERSGWRHAYHARLDGTITPITKGEFDVIDIAQVDAKGGWLYYLASPQNATQRYLYRVKLDGGTTERISPGTQSGTHSYDISEDARWAVHTYSNFTTPPVMQIVSLPGHQSVNVLADPAKLREKLAALKKPKAEFLRVDIGSGVELDAWCVRAADLDESKRHPLLMHVYGEPAGQTVKDAWGGSKMLWHWMLAQQGYIVASVDNRGTPAPRGREWRKCVYRQLGILSSAEQAEAVRALLKRWPFADPARVGIWGWSGGGSSSLDAIFRYPDLYRTAIAVAPVPDRRLYDSIYEERYMGLPKDNAEGYRLGSAITHAAALKGNLLMVHGTGDDNVHYQGVEKLINELIKHNKEFTVMPYPNRDHAIKDSKSTTRHLHELLTRFLHTNLPAGGASK